MTWWKITFYHRVCESMIFTCIYSTTESDIKCSGALDLSGSDWYMIYKYHCHLFFGSPWVESYLAYIANDIVYNDKQLPKFPWWFYINERSFHVKISQKNNEKIHLNNGGGKKKRKKKWYLVKWNFLHFGELFEMIEKNIIHFKKSRVNQNM